MLTLIHKECGGPALEPSTGVGEVCSLPVDSLPLGCLQLPGGNCGRIGTATVRRAGYLGTAFQLSKNSRKALADGF